MPFFKAYPMIPLSCNLAGRYLEEQRSLSIHKTKFSQAVHTHYANMRICVSCTSIGEY